ncbi:hypothetical protein [Xanthomonas phage RTH11]|nr:hypothetical protein [Xanthomonas phage RTH11]
MKNHYRFPVFYTPYNWQLEKIYPRYQLSRQREQRGRFVHSRKGKSMRRHPVRKTGRTFHRRKPFSLQIAG